MTSPKSEKINGVSFVAAREVVDSSHVEPVVKVNANYAAIMPFGFIKNLEHPEIIHNTDRQWFGETRAGAEQYISELRKADIKVMIKPQIWVWGGEFTGEIMMTTEEDWKALEDAYSSFILEYADMAEKVNAEIFCIGTELELFVKFRPEYWSQLIEKIKTVYKGKLTYAANWNEFAKTPFWDQLDYIGIDAYFPLSDKKTPSYEDCLEGWKSHKPIIEKLSKQQDRPILFTEYGYRSVDYSGRQPWVSDHTMRDVNLEAQVNTTKALFDTFWHEDWFAGGFVWKWFIMHDEVGGHDNPMFTPQNKPVEEVLREYYKN
ncbi:glycoside hydrolase [Winogradskyella sp. SYSU M77433]|uniref:glycoside hydrolase family 113 n=1 Tax=Winogradskyella sp. SYSU M77433 TaxID=3042722 RepID=UPI002480A2B9|nr:glycoside hydrolase [Winogradskyella sp. SYSU M77433]MDH7911886.1 glycoside hydrolase [Winogradskyella sp. SYSU M77433]